MRILVIGAGVLGCNVTADLLKAGKDVTLMARGAWYQTIRENGLRIKNRFSLLTKTYRVPVIDHLAEDDIYDVIFVSLRYTQLDSVREILTRNKSKNIVFNGNDPCAAELRAQYPDKRIMFSFAEAAGNRDANRVNSINLHKMVIGDLAGEPGSERLIRDAFGGTKIRIVYEPNMGDYLLSHAAFVVPVCFACYHAGGNLKKIRRDTAYFNRVIDANIECYSAIEKLGHAILPKEDAAFRSEAWRKKMLWFYKFMASTSLGKLCASDHAMSAVDEMAALADQMSTLIQKSGLSSEAFDELSKAMEGYLPKSVG